MLKIELIRFEAADVITSSLPIAEPTNHIVESHAPDASAPVVPEPEVPDNGNFIPATPSGSDGPPPSLDVFPPS